MHCVHLFSSNTCSSPLESCTDHCVVFDHGPGNAKDTIAELESELEFAASILKVKAKALKLPDPNSHLHSESHTFMSGEQYAATVEDNSDDETCGTGERSHLCIAGNAISASVGEGSIESNQEASEKLNKVLQMQNEVHKMMSAMEKVRSRSSVFGSGLSHRSSPDRASPPAATEEPLSPQKHVQFSQEPLETTDLLDSTEAAQLKARLIQVETELKDQALDYEKRLSQLRTELANSCSSAVMIRQAELSEASLCIYRERCSKLESDLKLAREEIQRVEVDKALSQGKVLGQKAAHASNLEAAGVEAKDELFLAEQRHKETLFNMEKQHQQAIIMAEEAHMSELHMKETAWEQEKRMLTKGIYPT